MKVCYLTCWSTFSLAIVSIKQRMNRLKQKVNNLLSTAFDRHEWIMLLSLDIQKKQLKKVRYIKIRKSNENTKTWFLNGRF